MMTKPPAKWMQALSPALTSVGALVASAGAGGFGVESTLPDGSVDVSTWPTILFGIVSLLGGIVTGQHNVTAAAGALPSVDGASTYQFLLSLTIQRAAVDGDEEAVKALAPLVKRSKKKPPEPESAGEGGGV